MQSIKLNSHVGSDGILGLDIPVDAKNTDLEVVITVKNIDSDIENATKSEWLPEFFERTAGAWQGKPLEREP